MLRRHILRIPCFFLLLWLAGAASAASPDTLVELTPGIDGPDDLYPLMYYKTIGAGEDIASAIAAGGFNSMGDKRTGFGRAGDPILMVINVVNRADARGTWVLGTGKVVLRIMEFCQLSAGRLIECMDSLAVDGRTERLQRYHAHALEFSLEPGEARTLALRYQASNISVLYPTIKTPMGHRQMIDDNMLVTAIATTATLVLIIVNACLFLLIRNTAFGYFVLAELAFVYHSLYLVNYTTIYLFPTNFPLGAFFVSLCLVSFALFTVRFAQVFLELPRRTPAFNRWLNGFLWIALVTVGLVVLQHFAPFTSSRNLVFWCVLVANSVSLMLPFLGIWSVWRLGAYYIPLMISWLVLGGVTFWYTLSAMSLLDGAHEARHWFGIIGFAEAFFISISIALSIRLIQNRERQAQVQLQEELEQKLVLVEQTNTLTEKRNVALTELAETGRMMLAAGHDAKNFLGALRQLASALVGESRTESSNQLAREVSDSADLLNRTLSVLMFRSGSTGARDELLALEIVDVERLFDYLKLVHERPALEKGLRLDFRSAVGSVPGDRTLVTRVLSNFISNAIRYSRRGRILVTARLRADELVFQVFDQGAGLEPEALEHLLQPDHERQRFDDRVAGEGVGLRIAMDLAARMGGEIRAASKPNRGSRFELHLPALLRPDAHRRYALLPPSIIDAAALETVTELLETAPQPEKGDLEGLDACFVTADAYESLKKRSALPAMERLILVTRDRSVEFRDLWSERVALMIYAPLDESLVLGAMSLLGRPQGGEASTS